MTRFKFWWIENSPNYGTGYRIVDTVTGENVDVTFITAMAGKDRYARKDQQIAYRIAEARVNKLNTELLR